MTNPKRRFDPLLDQIDQPLAEANVQANTRIGPNILRDDQHHVLAPERRRQADLQHAGRLQRYRVPAGTGGIEVAENFSCQLIDALRLRGRSKLARRPEKKLGPKLAFEQCDALADRRLTDPEFGRGRREAPSFQRPHKCTKAIDPIHGHSQQE
jgi:hypothetical protein